MPLESSSPPAPTLRVDPSLPAAGRSMVPPLLPILLPLVVAAIILGLVFAWWLPPVVPPGVEPQARFTDIAARAGLTFSRISGGTAENPPPSTLGGAVVVFDYDGDGHPDLFFVNGTPWPGTPAAAGPPGGRCALYHNDGTGHFADVSAGAGLNVEIQGMGAAAGDYDNDGHPDLFIAGVGGNRLFHNRGDGTFEDVTQTAGVGGDGHTWSIGATWIDYDGDGRLDLVVANYARWPAEIGLDLAFRIAQQGHSYGTPLGFIGALPSVYRNLGHGRFELVPDAAGLRNIDPQTELPVADTLAVAPVDANNDGRLDLLFTYQAADSALFLNQGNGSFREWRPGLENRREGVAAGLASASLLPLAQFSGADERLAALLSAGVLDPILHNRPPLALPRKLGFALLDYDHDGHLELFSGNGRAEANVGGVGDLRTYAAAPQLFWNRGDRWVSAPAAGADAGSWCRPIGARGVAAGDFAGNGSLDIVIAQNQGPPLLLRNDQRLGLPWLRLMLVATRSPREAGGARVEVQTPRRILTRTMAPAMGYMAQSESAMMFGLGEDARVRRIVIHWPSGQRQEFRPEALDRTLVVHEP